VLREFERAHEGRGGVVLISGEAGIGKSRLLASLEPEARARGFFVLRGACFESDRAVPYAPLLDLIRVFALESPRAVVAHCLAPAASELVGFWPELTSALGDVGPPPALDPEQSRRRLHLAVARAIDVLAKTQPVLIAFEDVHWSDEASLDLIRQLARSVSAQRVAIVLTFRVDEVEPPLERLLADFDRARVATDVSLARLAHGDVSTMVREILGARIPGADELTETLHALTDGNPFFVEEVMKGLVTSGDLSRATDGTWRVHGLGKVHVPRTALEAVRRRLGGLSVPARELAATAAVAGRRFDFTLLHAVTPHDDRELLLLVKELIAAQLVVEESHDRFAFRHALTREAIYAELLARERIALHREIAAQIERLHAGALDAHVQALAYHTFEAGDWSAARQWATRAAARATMMQAPREALAQLDRAFESAARANELPPVELLLARGGAAEMVGKFDAAHEQFTLAFERATRDGADTLAWNALHALGLLWSARDYVRAGDYRRDALALARTIGDPALIAKSLNRIGNWHINLEHAADAITNHDEALAIFERRGDEAGVTETVDLLAVAYMIGGDKVRSAMHYERSFSLLEARRDRRGIANALAMLALAGPCYHASSTNAWRSGRAARVLHDEEPLRLTREIDWRAGEAFCLEAIAECVGWRGEYDRALPMARAASEISIELQHRQWETYAEFVHGWLLLDLLAFDRAREHLEHGFALAMQLGSRTWIRWTAAPLVLARVHTGDMAAASQLLDDVWAQADAGRAPDPSNESNTLGERHLWTSAAELERARGHPARALEILDARLTVEARAAERIRHSVADAGSKLITGIPRLTLSKARALIELQRFDEAQHALQLAREAAESQLARPLAWRVEAEQARLHRARREHADARQATERARTIASALAATVPDDELRRTFERGIADALPSGAPATPRQIAKEACGGLTKRECDVARLVAAGKSNRAIARVLGLGERTVESHVASALAKLDFSSRTQLAAWAVARGLTTATAPNASH
jgi:DNA-binding CsgD family transcriptional regulator